VKDAAIGSGAEAVRARLALKLANMAEKRQKAAAPLEQEAPNQ
jgi:hypothetical protein